MYGSEMVLIRMLQLGVNGFLKKDIHPAELKDALLKVAAGEQFYNTRTAEQIVSLFKTKQRKSFSVEDLMLSDMEIEFLKLSATEMSYTEMAEALNVNKENINSFRYALFTKLQVHTRTELIVYAFQNGIITF